MEECSFVEEIKTEPSPIEDTEIEKSADEVKDCLKIESLLDNEQTWSKDLHPVDLQLTNEEVSIKTEVEEYDEKPHCVLLKKEIEDPVDSAIAGPSNCGKSYIDADCSIKQESDYDINEEFEIKNDADVEGENSEQSCSDDVEASKQDGSHFLESGDFDGENFNDLKKLIITEEHNYSRAWKPNHRSKLPTEKLKQNTGKPKNEMKCNLCEFSTTTRSFLNFHLNRVHGELVRYNCDLCDYSTTRNWNLKDHTECVHLKMKNYECFHCEFKANRKWKLRRHIEGVHLRKNEFKSCDSSTTQEKRLLQHIEKKHSDEIISKLVKKFRCHLCDYSTTEYYIFKIHVNDVHLKLRKYECLHCDYKAAQESSIRLHTDRIHLGKGEFKCDHCCFSTIFEHDLQHHIIIKHCN